MLIIFLFVFEPTKLMQSKFYPEKNFKSKIDQQLFIKFGYS